MNILVIIILFPFIYCTFTLTICVIVDIQNKNKVAFPIKSLFFESLLQYFVFIFLPFDLLRKWEVNTTKSNKYVFLLPGYLETQFIFFRIRKILRNEGVNFRTLKYKPFCGDLEIHSESLREEIETVLVKDKNAQIFIIGHSMGGLIGRYFVENFYNGNIRNLLMIATPHKGTFMGKLGIGKCSKQLIPNSPFLRNLKNFAMPNTRNIITESDSLICPRNNANYFNSNIYLAKHPLHNSTLFSDETIRVVKEILIN